MIYNTISFTSKPVKIGQLVKNQRMQLAYNKALANIFEQSDKDYFKLTKSTKVNKNESAQHIKTFADGLKNFFEKGTMF